MGCVRCEHREQIVANRSCRSTATIRNRRAWGEHDLAQRNDVIISTIPKCLDVFCAPVTMNNWNVCSSYGRNLSHTASHGIQHKAQAHRRENELECTHYDILRIHRAPLHLIILLIIMRLQRIQNIITANAISQCSVFSVSLCSYNK